MKKHWIALLVATVYTSFLLTFTVSAQVILDYQDGDTIIPTAFYDSSDMYCYVSPNRSDPPLYMSDKRLSSPRGIVDFMQPFRCLGIDATIKGVVVTASFEFETVYEDHYDEYKDKWYKVESYKYLIYDSVGYDYYVGIADSSHSFLCSVKATKGKKIKSTKNPYAYFLTAYFDSTITIPQGELFYTFIDTPKPCSDSLKYKWTLEKHNKWPIPLAIHAIECYGAPFHGPIGKNPKQKRFHYTFDLDTIDCDFTYVRRWEVDPKTGKVVNADTNWEVLGTGMTSYEYRDKYPGKIDQMVEVGDPTTQLYIFPIFGEVELDTVIKGGWTMQGDTLATFDSIIKGDTTILKSTFIVCDTIIAPDTMTTTKNGTLVDILQTGDTTISCDTLITYDTTINASIKQIDAGTLDRYSMLQPNPADKEVSVFSSFPIHKIEIYTYEGKKLDERRVASTNTVEGIDVSQYPSGTYFVVLHTSHGKVSKKLVIK